MGVRGLTQYLKKLENWEEENESWELKETDLIIDGSGLCFYFYENPQEYELNCEYGGEYSQLEEKAKEFFERLKSNEVRPYIVFDGIMDDGDKKLNTKLRRANECIGKDENDLQPGLTKQSIIQALEELEVPYVVADFAADSDIASLANIMNCPVMANDSDFLIFDIKQGYIPFNSYPGPDVNVERFFRNQVAQRLGIQPVLLPLLASLIGNDYVSEEMLKPFKENYNSPKKIVEFLSEYDSFDQAMTDVLEIIPDEQRKKFQETIEISVQQYQTKGNNLHIHDYFESGLHRSDLTFSKKYKTSTLEKIVKPYRSGKFGKQCMSIMCQSSVFLRNQNTAIEKCTKQIRTNVYKILMPAGADRSTPHKLTEYRRDGPSYGPHDISIETQADDMSIDTIENTSEDDKVTYLLQTTLSCELDSLENVPKEWWLVVAVLRYWYLYDGNKQLVTEAHLKALLLYQVNNNAKEHEEPKQLQEPDLKQDLQEPDLKQDLQGFIQWQDVVYWADILYSLLCINSLPVLRPAKLYDGEKVWKLYTKLHNGIQADKIVIDVPLFQQLHDAALKDLPSREQKFSQVRTKGKSRVSKKPKVKPEQKSTMEFLKGNRFALLSISSESDEED